ncbi:MAG: zinc-binding dehydrogenase [Gemmatimonadota bacterium]
MPEPGRFDVLHRTVPTIARDEVLLRVAVCGVCASELDMWRGSSRHATFPRYPGHEVAGVVEEVGADVESPAPGDHVAAWVTTRGFAEQVAVRAEHCVPVDGVPFDLALVEPLACAVNAVERTPLGLGDDVLIVGAGYMGLLILQLVAQRGPRHVIVADVRAEALDRARTFGATHVVDASRRHAKQTINDLADGQGVDVAIEATGTPPALKLVGEVTRMSGTIAIAGYHQGMPRAIDLEAWNWNAFGIVNAHFRDEDVIMHGMRTGARVLSAKRVAMEPLVTHRFPLDRIDDAFRTAVDKPEGFVKAVVQP